MHELQIIIFGMSNVTMFWQRTEEQLICLLFISNCQLCQWHYHATGLHLLQVALV